MNSHVPHISPSSDIPPHHNLQAPESGKPPKRRRPGPFSTLSGFLSLLLIVCGGLLVAGIFFMRQLQEKGPLQEDKVLILNPSLEPGEIATQLEQENIIENAHLFYIATLVLGGHNQLKSGEYLFKAHSSIQSVIDQIVTGRQVLHALTIPEGLTSEQILQRVLSDDKLAGQLQEFPKEGTLLPETYKFFRGYSRTSLIRKMQQDQKKLVEQIWTNRAPDLSLRTSFELIVLASIVEKETGKPEERARIARVFLNRLEKKMKLQSDPTIVYGLVGGRGTLGRGITKAELSQATPYNTYVIEGLPPGPISNPGRASLEAVANPATTRDLYFVADGTGGHVFAQTIEEHNKNVQVWRQIEKQIQERSPVPPENIDIDHVPTESMPLSGTNPPKPPDSQSENVMPKPAPNTSSIFGVLVPIPSTPPQPSVSPVATSSPSQRASSKIYDASEGTNIDPLLDKNWDLSTEKNVARVKATP